MQLLNKIEHFKILSQKSTSP